MNLRRRWTFWLVGSWLAAILLPALGAVAGSACSYCGDPLKGSYIEYAGSRYHADCYTRHIAPRCGVCNQPLEGEWVVFDDKNYHQACYENKVALRCSVCGNLIDGEYLIDHWGNKYHARHRSEIEACSFCGRLLSDPKADGGKPFDGDHHICSACNRKAVDDEKTGRRLLNQARTLLEKAGLAINHDDIRLELVSRRQFTYLLGQSSTDHFGLTHYEKSTTWGLLTDREFTVYIRTGLPLEHFISVAAHELMHIWQYLNTPEEGEPALVEGSCNYGALLVLRQLPDEAAGYVIEQLKGDPDPVYGEGFRRVKKLVDNRGLEFWLQHLRFDPEFPIGY